MLSRHELLLSIYRIPIFPRGGGNCAPCVVEPFFIRSLFAVHTILHKVGPLNGGIAGMVITRVTYSNGLDIGVKRPGYRGYNNI